MDDLVNKIMDSEKWPSVELPENLDLLNELADESFATQTFSGMLSAMLMYHQLIEAMCLHLLDDCHFFIQLSVYPAKIEFSIPGNKMLGYYTNELKNSVSFYKKDEFLSKIGFFNSIRNEVIHEMRKNNLEIISEKLKLIKNIFDEIYDLYDQIQDEFRVDFHSFKKDVFIDE